MNNQSTLKGHASSAGTSKDEVCETVVVPTYPTEQMNQKVTLDVKTLTDPASADALRVADPFLYYSCFTPSKTLSSKLANLVLESKQSKEEPNQTKLMEVTRQGRVSAESDGLELLLRDFQGLQDANDAHNDEEEGNAYDDLLLSLYPMLGMDMENAMQDDEAEEFILNEPAQKQ